MEKLLLKFIRRFYKPNLDYTDSLIKEWVNISVRFFIAILVNGITFWLVLLSLMSIFPLTVNLGPGVWNILNIFQLGLILWFFKELYNFVRRKKK